MEEDIPSDAAAHCPGTKSEVAGKSEACAGCPNQQICITAPKGPDPDVPLIAENLSDVKNRILILSVKGGVGKSTVTASLARALASDPQLQVGILDVDICGPSQPQMMGVSDATMYSSQLGWSPVLGGENGNLAIVSVGFLLKDESEAVIWRGGKKNALVKQFLRDVQWEHIDYLLVDTPPGTSDEHLALAQLVSPITGAILVTTPQEVAWQDVRKGIDFCRKVKIPILGIVENMAGFICPNCEKSSEIFSESKMRQYAQEHGIPLLASIPIDPRIGMSCDEGESIPIESPAHQQYMQMASNIIKMIQEQKEQQVEK